ncbi:zinc finger protein [Saccharopolyspora phatthalungensis]|uniref:zinc finger protein n=1 Tax=Saccharopolyspora phatthalungensis TaxID=664693 RepID=UPI0028AF2153|nr:zinc finger protein [Saccharopolyspora phatthalungensis]
MGSCWHQRHATPDQRPAGGWPEDAEVTALCNRRIRPESGELAWLWPTCPECDVAAHVLAGAPMVGSRRPTMPNSLGA